MGGWIVILFAMGVSLDDSNVNSPLETFPDILEVFFGLHPTNASKQIKRKVVVLLAFMGLFFPKLKRKHIKNQPPLRECSF